MNDKYGLTPENLLRALPEVLKRDEHMNALAENIAQVLSNRCGEIESLTLYPNIEELPEELLDILAHDFNVAWWDRSLSQEAKRRTIRESWHIRKRMGTKYAVELALAAAFGSGEVTEWFEYGGDPYHFRIRMVNLANVWEQYDTFLNVLETVKRKSAALDSFSTLKAVEMKLYCGMAMTQGRKTELGMSAVDTSQFVMLTDENGDALIEEDGLVVLDG